VLYQQSSIERSLAMNGGMTTARRVRELKRTKRGSARNAKLEKITRSKGWAMNRTLLPSVSAQ
jgi:hypothetical protein